MATQHIDTKTVGMKLNDIVAFMAEKYAHAERTNMQLEAALGQAMREASAAAGEVKRLQAELEALKAAPTAAPAAEAA